MVDCVQIGMWQNSKGFFADSKQMMIKKSNKRAVTCPKFPLQSTFIINIGQGDKLRS